MPTARKQGYDRPSLVETELLAKLLFRRSSVHLSRKRTADIFNVLYPSLGIPIFATSWPEGACVCP